MTQLVQNDLIYDTESTSVYKGILIEADQEVIIKIPKGSDYSGIYNEYNLLHQESLPGKALAIEHIQTRPALIRSYLPGSTLKSFIQNGRFGVPFFFEYAIAITRQLLAVHACSIIHKDISPYNIILDPATRQAAIIDFEFSTKTRTTSASLFESFSLLGNVYYISPEQTGRMNRSIDYRTDYYSLGIVFYEMLTGQLPFQSNDILELVHCHIARNLPRMTACDPTLPEMLLRIVDKLTAKNAEERYQSLNGLLVDLQQCRQSWLASQTIPLFEAGQQDFPDYPHVSQKMVGRGQEVAAVLRLFEQSAGGNKVFLTVGGLSGVGKSTLINETAKPLTRHRGIILRGKFDSLQKNIPYYGWMQAFDQFADLVLSQSAGELASWRQRFTDKLQNLDSLLVQLVPKLAKLFGPSAELTPLGGLELKNRLHYAIGLFLEVLASAEHPLVLFLDDWQWADEDSIRLLDTILKKPFLSHLLLVAAYRSNEVTPAHPFYSLTQKNEEHHELDTLNNLVQDHIQLYPLPESAILEVLQNSLPGAGDNLEDLARITFSKTQGNPFFVNQFLTLLTDRNLLWMNQSNHSWQWDTEAIHTLSVDDNVLEITLTKIKALPKETLRALTTVSAAGSVISLNMSATVLNTKASDLHRMLWPAIQNSCLLPLRSDYKYIPDFYEDEKADVHFRFAHDRLQQTLYDELSTPQKEALHLAMGQYMLPVQADSLGIFEAANHFLRSAGLIPSSNRQEEILETLQRAGEKAYQSAAFETAFHYLALWESLVTAPTTAALPVYRMLIETAHLSNRVPQSPPYESKALGLCQSQDERSQIYEVMIRSYTASGHMDQVGDITHRALKELGVSIPRKAAKWQVVYQAIRSRFVLTDARIATIHEWPAMTDSRYIWAVRILNVSLPAYYLAKFETYPMLIFKLVDLNTRYGVTREAIIGFGSYGLILAGLLNAPDSGYLAGKQAMRLLDRFEADDLVAQAGFVDSTFIAHWKEPMADLAARCFEYYVQGLSKGDILYSGWNLYMRSTAQFYVGEKLSVLLEGMKAQESFFRQHNLTNMWQKSVHERYFIQRLATPGYEDPTFDWEGILGTFTEQNDLTGLFTLYSHRTIFSLAMGNYQEAWEMSLLAEKHAETVKSVFSYQLFSVYQAVAGLAFYEQADTSQQRTIRKIVKKIRTRLEESAKRQEENYRWGVYFVNAETERVLNGRLDVPAYYEALEAARSGKMTFPGLMVRIQLVRSLLKYRHSDAREEYLKLRAELLNLNMEGVLASLDGSLASTFAEKRISADFPRGGGGTLKHSNYVSGFQFDTQTFIKSIEALTGELQLDKLLNRLMSFAIENAGADYGVFLLRRDGAFQPVVAMNAEGVPTVAPQEQESAIPASIFNYVVQSGEVIRLDNASETTPFAGDPLVIQNRERSVLCIPLKNKGQINAVIYLTNRLTENTFTEERVGLLKVLAGQISLSIENALLYETMEKLVEERTSQLEAEKKKSDHLLLNILPEQVAEELKQYGKARPRYYDLVTIMFCDFKNFTGFAESETPESLIETLDYCFRMFDKIIKRHNIEKIKTIGDAYLCVSGLPQANPTHALDVLKAAMEFQEWIQKEATEREAKGQKFLEIRIGIHTGSVVAGVVGDSKFAYDIWGDAVNTAARMEQSGQAGKINISSATYQLVTEHYHCIYRGKVQAKNKGDIDMYFVEKSLSMPENSPQIPEKGPEY